MKFPLSWLKEFVTLTQNPTELADTLSMAGLEVESIDTIGQDISHIITGKIQRIDPHPNADKLVITTIFDGKNQHQIVTGATNITVGDIVPVSLPGATLAGGLKIKPTSLRGVPSNGMLCSPAECGIDSDVDGIWLLPSSTELGIDFIEFAQLSDTVLDVAILPNRGDCQSMLGLAREIATLTGQRFTLPDIQLKSTSVDHTYSVTSESNHCPYYIGRYITDIQLTATPLWMARRLELAGLRSINLAVDITNYVLLETGQPLHAFDDSLCSHKTITIKSPSSELKLTTLDDQQRIIQPGQLLIYEGDCPVAIAGIMGAKNTEVSDTTSTIFLEAAYFDSTAIRRCGTALGLRTDSAIRFEKGVYADMVDYASSRAAQLYQQLAKATVSNQVATYKHDKHACFKSHKIAYDLDQINAFLGTSISSTIASDCLLSLGFSIKDGYAQVPMWRQHDVTSWPCLAEELLRCLGFNQIKGNFNHQVLANNMHDPLVDLTDRVQQFFVANGFNELNTYPMISQKDISWLQLKSTDNTTISNPISPEFSVMRPSLLPSFMRILHYHHQRQMSSGAYFEVGRQFKPDGETTTLAMAISDAYMINHYNDAQTKLAKTIFQHGCHHLKRWLSSLSIEATFTETTGPCFAHPHYYQELTVGNNVLGYITTCHPSYLDHYDIATPVIFAEICLDVVLHLCNHTPTYRPFSRFPSTRRDIALVVPKDLTYDTILTFINQYKHKTVVDVGVFDVFKSEQLGPDQTSIGIYFIYQDMATTLADDKVNKAHDRLCKRLVNELPVVIR